MSSFHLVLDVALLIAAFDIAEPSVEQILATQHDELFIEPSMASASHFDHGRLQVVVRQPARHAAEELGRANVAVEERFHILPFVGADERVAAVGQPNAEQLHLAFASIDDHGGFAAVDLRFLARSERQRHVDLRRLGPSTGNVPTDGDLRAGVAIFVA